MFIQVFLLSDFEILCLSFITQTLKWSFDSTTKTYFFQYLISDLTTSQYPKIPRYTAQVYSGKI
jgi:hypothetical protein